MKRYLAFLTIALALFACKKTQPTGEKYLPGPVLATSTGTIQFDANGGEAYLTVSGAKTLTAKSDRDWVLVTVDGAEVVFNAGFNNSFESRYASVLISDGTASRAVEVVQFGYSSKYVWEEEYSFTNQGGTLSLLYEDTDNFIRVKVEEAWISAIPAEGVFSITVEKNSGVAREGAITWQCGDDVRIITIKQAAGTSGGGDNPGGDGEGADGSYSGYLGTWTDASGNTLRLEVFPEHEGEAYIAYYSGFALDGEVVPFPAFYEDNAITFYSAVLHEYDDAPLMIYFCAMDTDGYIELGGPDEDQKLAYSTLSNGGKSINIIGNKYKAVYSGTTYDEEIAKLMVRLYADSDYENYQAGYFYAIGMEDMNLPASFVKGGNSTSVNAKSVKNDFWTPFMKGSLWAPQTRRIR